MSELTSLTSPRGKLELDGIPNLSWYTHYRPDGKPEIWIMTDIGYRMAVTQTASNCLIIEPNPYSEEERLSLMKCAANYTEGQPISSGDCPLPPTAC